MHLDYKETIPARVLAVGLGVFKLLYGHPEEKKPMEAKSYSLRTTGAFWLLLHPD